MQARPNVSVSRFDRKSLAIGSRIFTLRRARGLTRQQLANLSGVDRCVIFQIEIGRTKAPQIRVLEKLSRAMGVGVGRFLDVRGTTLTMLEDPLINTLRSLVKNLGWKQREQVIKTLRYVGGPAWLRKT